MTSRWSEVNSPEESSPQFSELRNALCSIIENFYLHHNYDFFRYISLVHMSPHIDVYFHLWIFSTPQTISKSSTAATAISLVRSHGTSVPAPKESGRMGAKLLGLVTKRDADFVEATWWGFDRLGRIFNHGEEVSFMAGQPTPPLTYPPRNKALLRAY